MTRWTQHFACALALATASAAHAAGEPDHPMIDFSRVEKQQPLEDIDTDRLILRRDSYEQALSSGPQGTGVAELEQLLLEALLHYDTERIRIVELIPQMIELYEVDAELAEDMMNFRTTLLGVIEELRPEATTLQRYKPYDFRVGISYMSLMTTLQNYGELREQMLADQADESTLLGTHRQQLSLRYRGVEQARERLEQHYRQSDLEEQIARIDDELLRRQSL